MSALRGESSECGGGQRLQIAWGTGTPDVRRPATWLGVSPILARDQSTRDVAETERRRLGTVSGVRGGWVEAS